MDPTPSPAAPSLRLSREAIEAREDRDLAPFAQRAAASAGRVHPEAEHAFRTAFMRDRDRVIHASAFRRLEYKTQVFLNHKGDYYRTRLTHTIEVAQVARTVARALRLNEDLVEAIALSHDVGHGPFGHAGESALDEAMEGHGGFEHNAHGLRVVDRLEHRYAAFAGLNLSHEVREAFAMHSPADKRKLGFERRRPLLEAQLVDTCDNLTYTAHDLDDGIESGCVAPEDLRDASLWAQAWDGAVAAHPGEPRRLLVLAAVKRVLDACATDLLDATAARIAAAGVGSPAEVQRHPRLLVGYSDAFGKRQRELARLLHERFYRHPRQRAAAEQSRARLKALFAAYLRAPRRLPEAHHATLAEEGPHRAVCDHLASLTDRQALRECRALARRRR